MKKEKLHNNYAEQTPLCSLCFFLFDHGTVGEAPRVYCFYNLIGKSYMGGVIENREENYKKVIVLLN
jgi:hypothetical protein